MVNLFFSLHHPNIEQTFYYKKLISIEHSIFTKGNLYYLLIMFHLTLIFHHQFMKQIHFYLKSKWLLLKASFYTNYRLIYLKTHYFTFEFQLCSFSIANPNILIIVPNDDMLLTIAHACRLYNLSWSCIRKTENKTWLCKLYLSSTSSYQKSLCKLYFSSTINK